MIDYARLVIDLYKKCFADYKAGFPIRDEAIAEIQKLLYSAIDIAVINGAPTNELEALKYDIDYLKYELVENA